MTVPAPARTGDWMLTASGKVFWPLDPRPDEIEIDDIAHALSHLCRYAGHCRKFYSVAQHSVLVARALPPEHQRWGLLHDATEAYLVDVPRPVKPYLSGYHHAEERLMQTIISRFDLDPAMPAEVKRVDDAILADEFAQIMPKTTVQLHLPEPALGVIITSWPPETARTVFLNEFRRLFGNDG